MTQKTSRKCFKTAPKRLQEKAFPLLPNHIKRKDKQPTSLTKLLSRNNPFDMHRHCNSQLNRPKKPAQTAQKHKKRGFIEETQKQEAQERPMGTASCLKKTCMRRNRQADAPHDKPDSQPLFRPTGIISHATLPPHGTFSAKWCTALHQPSQCSASAIAARCDELRSAVRVTEKPRRHTDGVWLTGLYKSLPQGE